jgi:uncharacterized membrane protein YcaP (DUF421 family)
MRQKYLLVIFMTVITVRALIFYIILTLMMKLMGKRQIGEMQVSELVTTVLLSELAVLPITDNEIPLLHGLVPLVMISSIEVIVSYASRMSSRFRTLLNGNPITLYEKNKFIEANLTKARVSTEDVEAQVRINGFACMGEVSKVILERTGKMSVLPKQSPNPNQSGE